MPSSARPISPPASPSSRRSTRTRLQARARSARWWRSARRVGTRVIRAKHGQSRRAWRAEHASALERQVPDVIGGGRGIRTPKGLAARWISSPLPCQLRLALRLPHTLSQYHYLTNGLARYLLGLVSIIVRGDSLFVRVSLQRALGLSQCGQKVLSLHDSVT